MISIWQAARHLRLDSGHDEWTDLRSTLDEAIAIAAVYIGQDPGDFPFDLTNWEYKDGLNYTAEEKANAAAAEAFVKAKWQDRAFDAAVLLIFGELWAHREAGTANPLSPAVKALLDPFKPLVFA